jgi:uncharacterized protein
MIEERKEGNNSWIGLMVLGVSLAIGIIISTLVIAKTVEKVKIQNQRIQIKGFAEQKITSDLAVWQSRITTRSQDLVRAYNKLKQDLQKVLTYLEQKGIDKKDIEVSSVSTTIQYQLTAQGVSTNVIDGYVLDQNISITSPNVTEISELANESTSLIEEGIEFASYTPQYYYTKLDDLKIQLLGEATKNARLRAEELAKNSGSEVGTLKYASQGVFQITPVHSTDVSDYGIYDTTTIDKSIKAVVTIEYSIK